EGAAGVGDQPDPGEDLDEAGALAGHAQVAGQGQAAAGTGGDPVDGGDDRLLQVADAQDDGVPGLAQVLADGTVPRLAADGLQVLPGAEGPPGAGDDHGPHLGVASRLLEGGQQVLGHLVVQRVEDLGPVEGDGQHALVQLVANGFKDRKSTRLNSSHVKSSYAVFCLKKKKDPLRPAGE